MTDSPASPIWQHFAAANQPQWAESARATAASAMSELRAALDAELRGSLESMAQVSAQLNTVVDDFQAAYRGVRVAIARAIAGEEEACDALAQSLQRTVARYSATHADLTMLLEIIRTETAGLLTTATQRERQIVGELNTTIAQWLAWQSGFVRRQHDYFERLVGRASGVEPALRYELIRQLREVADQLEVADPEAGSP